MTAEGKDATPRTLRKAAERDAHAPCTCDWSMSQDCPPDVDEPSGAHEVLTAWLLHEWYEDWDLPAAKITASDLIDLLNALPVEQRMEAMGMERAGHKACELRGMRHDDGRWLYVEVSDAR